MRTTSFLSVLALAALLAGLWGEQQWLSSALGQQAAAQDQKKPDATKEAKKPVIAIVGADIYTVTKGTIRGGIVLIQDGKIIRAGQDIAIPEGATRIDATGKVVTPGFVTVSATNLALRALGTPAPGGDQPAPGSGGAQGKFADSLNPFDRNILFCLGSGITTACVEVNAGFGGRFGRDPEDLDDTRLCPCCGLPILPTEPITPAAPTERTARRQAVLKMTYGDMSAMLVKESPFYHLPPGAFAGALNRHQWRDTIKRARQQIKDQAMADAGIDAGDAPARGGQQRRAIPEEVLKLVERKIPLRTEASSVEQMRDMIALAKELDYSLVLDGVQEAWLIASELGAAKAQAVLTPRLRRRPSPGKEDSSGGSIETSAHLEKAGVAFAVAPLNTSVSLDGIPGRDLTSLAIEAAFAVRGGCSEQTALEALTINPARMLGLADRIGSIEEGKDADLLILDGPPLDYRTYVETAVVGGRIYYDRDRDKIYPDKSRRP